MDAAQTWTLIGGFFALMIAMTGMTLRVVRAEISVLSSRMDGQFGRVDGQFSRVEARLDHLDRDLQAVVARLMEP